MISVQQYRVSIGSFHSRTSCKGESTKENKCDDKTVGVILVSLVLLAAMSGVFLHSHKIHMLHKQLNKLVHILEGNKNPNGYKLSQWNCGSAWQKWKRRLPEYRKAI